MIAKVIHYCWFGDNKKPKIVEKCIQSWKDNLVGYEIKEWNESNFDISSNEFVKQAYKDKKFAFVSDYVRVYALYNYGGIYLDTDVEIYKEFSEEILENEVFFGFEEKNYIATSTIGAKKNNKFIGSFLDLYKEEKFNKEKITTNVAMLSKVMENLGVKLDGSYQKVDGVATIYPQEYFSPYDYINCYSKKTENSYTVHHFHKSWLPLSERIKGGIKKVIVKIIGGRNISKIRERLTK